MIDDREEFFATVRHALGRSPGEPPEPAKASAISSTLEELRSRAQEIRRLARERSSELVAQLEARASQAKWQVARVGSEEEARRYIKELALSKQARLVLRSAHPALDRLRLEEALSSVGIEAKLMALGEGKGGEDERKGLRELAIRADIGVTGVDYAIAETGTCVLIPRRGVSRLVSLLPPVHVAVVEPDQVLERAEDVLTLRRQEFMEKGDLGSYMSFITGPSRTADIEQTISVGVHGPKEAHMVILG